MKKATSYAVVTQPYTWGALEVMAVTTRKANGRVYGRNLDGEATNRAARDVKGHYATEDAAKDAAKRIEAARESFTDRLAELARWERDVRAQQQNAMTEAAREGRIA